MQLGTVAAGPVVPVILLDMAAVELVSQVLLGLVIMRIPLDMVALVSFELGVQLAMVAVGAVVVVAWVLLDTVVESDLVSAVLLAMGAVAL